MTKRPLRIAHRGDSGNKVENTITSFESALSKGVDWIELDVQWVHNTLVVFHDHSLHRVAKISKSLDALPLDELLAIDIGEGCTIPTLLDAAGVILGRASLNIELKGFIPPTAVKEAVETLLNRGWNPSHLLLSSFNHQLLGDLKGILPQVRRAPLFYEYSLDEIRTAQSLDSPIVGMHQQLVHAERVAEFHRHNMLVFVFVVNEHTDIARMRSIGVDGIITNYPERLI